MKKILIYSLLLLACGSMFVACGGDDDSSAPPKTTTITAQPENLSVEAAGGTFNINVTTTGAEWGAYSNNEDWIKVSIDDEEGKLQEMVDQGLTVINLTPEELKTFQDGTASVKDHFADQLDDGVLEKYEAALAAVR